MHVVLTIAAACFVLYALLQLNDQPGLFAGIVVNSYGLATYFGSTGGVFGIIAILYGLSRWKELSSLQRDELFLLGWLVFSLVTVPFSPQLPIAADYAGGLIFLAFSCYLLGRAGGSNPNFVRDMFLSSCIVVALCEPSIASVTQILSRDFGDQNAVGLSQLIDIPIVGCMTYLLLDQNLRGWRKLGLASLFVFAVVPIAFSFGTRGVFVGAFAAFIVLLLARLSLGYIERLVADFIRLAALVGAAGFAVLLYFPIPPALLFVASRVFINLNNGGGFVADTSGLLRLRFYEEAKDLFLSAPILGHGLGSFGYLANFSAGGYPHNAILEILVNSGLVGLALFLAGAGRLFQSALTSAFRQASNCQLWLIVALLIYTFTRMQFSESITRGKVFFLLLGVCATLNKFLVDRRSQQSSANNLTSSDGGTAR